MADPKQHPRTRSRRRVLNIARIALLFVGITLATDAFWLEPASLERNEYLVTLKLWPSECDGLRLAVLADLHVGSPHNGITNLERVVAQTNEAQPDAVLLAGDYVIHNVIGGQFVSPEDAARVLARLRAPLGVFAVLGNHDWWLDARRVSAALGSAGITMLEDASASLAHAGCSFTLIGVSDFWEGPHDVVRAFSGVRAGTPTLLFTHNPDVFPELPRPVTLAIAGHTHGGQVALPFIGRPIVPSRYGERFAAGRIVEDGQTYFVSTGVGTSILPVRFGVPPEVTVLRLASELR